MTGLDPNFQTPGMFKLWVHDSICTKSIQIYFGIFFDFILVLLSFHCSHTVPIFSEFSLFFLPFYSFIVLINCIIVSIRYYQCIGVLTVTEEFLLAKYSKFLIPTVPILTL